MPRIDVSKKTLDVSIQINDKHSYLGNFSNDKKGISALIREMKSQGLSPKETLVCMEHTGIYTHLLLDILYNKQWQIWLAQAVDIKKSLGNQRGKNDKVDASRITEYAQRFQDKAVLWQPPRKEIIKLRHLVALRARFKKVRKMLNVPVKELGKLCGDEVIKYNNHVIKSLDAQIKEVEKKIEKLIEDDAHLRSMHEIVTSVDGVGKVTSGQILVHTNEFKDFDSAKKFACYSGRHPGGVVPFDFSSGSSIRSKPRVSHQANKKMKELLHLSALSATVMKGELNDYYNRKVAEEKNKMLVLNNIRNKLIHRIFKCVKENRKYEKIYTAIVV
ncbi:MAG: transposase [Bacteroidota bacterium]